MININKHRRKIPEIYAISLIFLTLTLVFLLLILQQLQRNITYRSKAAGGKTLTVCADATGGCQYVGGVGLQQAVDAAQNGDIVQVSGTLTNRTPTVDTAIKFEKCMVNLRGKDITIRGPAKLYGENGSYTTPNWDMVIGVCSNGGNITVENIQVMQTLRQGFYFQNANVILKGVSTNDIDNINAEFIGGNVAMSNSIFGGGAITLVRGGASARMINNTMGMGLSVDLCGGSNPSAYVVNNIFLVDQANPGLTVKCSENIKLNPNSKIAFNMTGVKDGCSASGEYCEGMLFGDPKIINSTIYGDIGWSYAINWDLQPDSPALTAGDGGVKLGATGNACAAPASDACKVLNSPLAIPSPTAIPTSVQPTSTYPFPTYIPTDIPTPTGRFIPSQPTPTSYLTRYPTFPANPSVYPYSSPTPFRSQNLPTPTPSPTLAPGQSRINLKLKFQGVVATSLLQSQSVLPVTITLDHLFDGIPATVSADFWPGFQGVWNGSFIPSNLTPGSDYSLLLKGSKHLSRRICDAKALEATPGGYKCGSSGITLQSGENYIDAGGVYLFAGDINQDEIVDAADISVVIANLGKTNLPGIAMADLNFDGVVDSQDYSLVIQALKIRFDDEK